MPRREARPTSLSPAVRRQTHPRGAPPQRPPLRSKGLLRRPSRRTSIRPHGRRESSGIRAVGAATDPEHGRDRRLRADGRPASRGARAVPPRHRGVPLRRFAVAKSSSRDRDREAGRMGRPRRARGLPILDVGNASAASPRRARSTPRTPASTRHISEPGDSPSPPPTATLGRTGRTCAGPTRFADPTPRSSPSRSTRSFPTHPTCPNCGTRGDAPECPRLRARSALRSRRRPAALYRRHSHAPRRRDAPPGGRLYFEIPRPSPEAIRAACSTRRATAGTEVRATSSQTPHGHAAGTPMTEKQPANGGPRAPSRRSPAADAPLPPRPRSGKGRRRPYARLASPPRC